MNPLKAKFVVAGLASLLLVSSTALAERLPSGLEPAVAALSTITGQEHVQWNTVQARTADVTCDGKPDIVMFGIGNHSVWMGVVPGGGGKPQGMKFPYPSGSQVGFSNRPVRINLYPLDCDTDTAGHLAGCRQVKRCKAFDLDDDKTDPFNFYWDDEHKRLDWWRN